MRKFINFSLKSEKCVKTWMYPLEAQEIRRVNSMAIILLIQRLKSTIERQSSFHILKCCTVNCPLYLNTPSARVPKVAISGAKVPQDIPNAVQFYGGDLTGSASTVKAKFELMAEEMVIGICERLY